jgi:hypothetical protein
MITVKVDATRALAKFSPAGIPEAVRRNLRRVLPDLTRKLSAAIDARLASGLKSRRSLEDKVELVENPTAIFGRVRVIANAPSPAMLPAWLNTGTAPHEIAARNASALFFFWERLGMNVMFRRVMHPGFAGINYAEGALADMRGEIVDTIGQAGRQGAAVE